MDIEGNAPKTVVIEKSAIQILPYTLIVGQHQIKLALELDRILPLGLAGCC